jgi:predicted DsbA family dithiol-disulfide isomerase
MNEIYLFTGPKCPKCIIGKHNLTKAGFKYRELNVESDILLKDLNTTPRAIARKHNIRNLPTAIGIEYGLPISRAVGAYPVEGYKKIFQKD